MSWKVSLVPFESIKATWPTIAPMLARAVPYSAGRMDLRSLLQGLLEQRYLLWIAYDDTAIQVAAAFITRVAVYSHRASLVIDCAGGSQMRHWLHLASDTFRSYARDTQLVGIEMFGRPGWARVLKSCGWQQKLVLMEISAALVEE